MKFYYPKFKEKYAVNDAKFQEEWSLKKEDFIEDYLTNPNRFGLVTDVVKEDEVLGMMSATMSKSIKSKLFSGLKDAVTLTKEVDTAHYYLVATSKGLHYLGFDGNKCFINEVFDYNQITEKKRSGKSFTFEYKGEKIKFDVDAPLMLWGYPRFNVHERSRTPTANDRSMNYFVREYLAYEQTNNAQFNNSGVFKISIEASVDLKIREYFINGIKNKLSI